MFDFHYDLLTKLYISYLNNDFCEVEAICQAFRQNNIKALLANLCFETEAEMKKEYHPNYWNPEVGIKEMFQITVQLAKKYIPSDIEVYYSIEGCDFLEIEDLEEFYQMGLRSILPVWNHSNQYGSGNRTCQGLTPKGKALIEKAVEVGIAIDLSHMNEKTFEDSLNVIENLQKQGKKAIFFASHSNIRRLCNIKRNLTDEQCLKLCRLGGKIGLLSNRNFVIEKALQKHIPTSELEKAYLKQVLYLEALVGGVDFIVLSTDDMGWDAIPANDPELSKLAIYPYQEIANRIKNTFYGYYTEDEIEKMMYQNGKTLFYTESRVKK